MNNMLRIPHKRLSNVLQSIDYINGKLPILTARDLARFAGKIISLMPVMGNVCKLMTKHMYKAIESRLSWESSLNIYLIPGVLDEFRFWQKSIITKPERPLFNSSLQSFNIYSDASQVACAAYIKNESNFMCHRNWTVEESVKSSTWRELQAVLFALQSFLSKLSGFSVRWFTDSQNCARIVESGSTHHDLHMLSLQIFELCIQNKISLNISWIPRESNQIADYLSKLCDIDDWGVSIEFFKFMDDLWGPHTIDRFANHYNNRVDRFNSLVWVPGTEAVDAFSVDWSQDNNWLVPPIYLVPRVIKHLQFYKASGTLIVPYWPSAPFWPLLFGNNNNASHFISDILEFPKGQDIYVQHRNKNSIFGSPVFSSKLLAVRFEPRD